MSGFAADTPEAGRWAEAWPDAMAFAGGLAVAWFAGWATTDLVWSLWLSSLLAGYAMIIWSIFAPTLLQLRVGHTGAALGALAVGLFLLAFFTFHFGMFHLVHSVFLGVFFPIGPKQEGLLNLAFYAEVFSRYWYFVPLALLAERRAFRLPVLPVEPLPPSATEEEIQQRKVRNLGFNLNDTMMAPYKNVIRLHLLIFFFAAAHFAKLDGFPVYAVVYAVYFFPWRLLRKTGAGRS